jgi:hypothetical protein
MSAVPSDRVHCQASFQHIVGYLNDADDDVRVETFQCIATCINVGLLDETTSKPIDSSSISCISTQNLFQRLLIEIDSCIHVNELNKWLDFCFRILISSTAIDLNRVETWLRAELRQDAKSEHSQFVSDLISHLDVMLQLQLAST